MCEKWTWPAPGGQAGVGRPHTGRALPARLRGLLALMVCLCLTLTLLPAPAQAAAPTGSWTDEGNYNTDWYGDGSANSFTISTAAELAGLAKLSQTNEFSGKTITLAADIDLSAHLWTPIGGTRYHFSGTFNGGGHTIRGMTVSGGASAGFFFYIGTTAKIYDLKLENASVHSSDTYGAAAGILAGITDGGAIYNCAVSGSVSGESSGSGNGVATFLGGLVGFNTGTIKNSSARIASIEGTSTGGVGVGGISGLDPSGRDHSFTKGRVENCVAVVGSVSATSTGGGAVTKYALAHTASYSYWGDTTALTDSGTPAYTQCYPVTGAQMEGTSGEPIGTGSYANTPSLLTALNSWVAAQSDGNTYKQWAAADLASFLPPEYIDISGPLDETTHQSATGEIQTGMELEGQLQESVTLLSVTLPSSIPFIVDIDESGVFKRLLSATGNVTSNSDCAVAISLETVKHCDKLKLLNLYLVPDPAAAGYTRTPLAEGDMALPLGRLPASQDAPSSFTLEVQGEALTAQQLSAAGRQEQPSLGTDGETFTVDTIFKVARQEPEGRVLSVTADGVTYTPDKAGNILIPMRDKSAAILSDAVITLDGPVLLDEEIFGGMAWVADCFVPVGPVPTAQWSIDYNRIFTSGLSGPGGTPTQDVVDEYVRSMLQTEYMAPMTFAFKSPSGGRLPEVANAYLSYDWTQTPALAEVCSISSAEDWSKLLGLWKIEIVPEGSAVTFTQDVTVEAIEADTYFAMDLGGHTLTTNLFPVGFQSLKNGSLVVGLSSGGAYTATTNSVVENIKITVDKKDPAATGTFTMLASRPHFAAGTVIRLSDGVWLNGAENTAAASSFGNRTTASLKTQADTYAAEGHSSTVTDGSGADEGYWVITYSTTSGTP